MSMPFWNKGCALAAAALMLQGQVSLAQNAISTPQSATPLLTVSPKSSDAVQKMVIKPTEEAPLTHAQKLALLQKNIKYVFVLFQENRSFDFYFGSYPGANGLFSQAPSQTPGFTQKIVNTDGSIGTITPFRIPITVQDVNGKTVPIYPADTDSVNHSHTAYIQKIDVQSGVTQNDQYALAEEGITLNSQGVPSKVPSQAQKQMGELVMGYVDCNTAPVLWNYADKFALFDNFHQTVLSASTPNAIAMIAGQSGETQWVKHPEQSTKATSVGGNGVPVVSDGDPFWGSQLDTYHTGQPANPPSATPNPNLTFATLPLSFMGSDITALTDKDPLPQIDLPDIKEDIAEIQGKGNKPTNWAWFQQGYDHELNDPGAAATHADYIPHHNAPQYFGYVAANPAVSQPHLYGLTDFAYAMYDQLLPADGGVAYVRGGYNNIQGLSPVDPNAKLATVFNGNDDHPGYSDLQISGALVADEVNAIVNSPYWPQSAIIITYDETDGLYDHAPETIRDYDPYGNPLDAGPRIPTIIISPYGVTHTVDHEYAEHSSIVKFIDELFNLTPLADLPDEAKARKQGQAMYGQADLGPADDKVAYMGNLFSAFSNNRLMGTAAPIPASYAAVPANLVNSLPQLNNQGCSVLQITPTDNGKPNPVPMDFNPRPNSTPGVPTSGIWVP